MRAIATRNKPRIGDIVAIKSSHGKGEPLMGIVLSIRTHKDNSWTGVEVFQEGKVRWVTRGQVERIVGRPKGISRIDQPTRRTHGWFVRVDYEGKNPRLARLFSDQKFNGISESLRAALEFYAAEKHVSAVPPGVIESSPQP
jgi:hypothetical protein